MKHDTIVNCPFTNNSAAQEHPQNPQTSPQVSALNCITIVNYKEVDVGVTVAANVCTIRLELESSVSGEKKAKLSAQWLPSNE